ncbi:3-deoxy-D-manno-octulosonic acid transferase [Paracoccus sp. TK19116]|uniref:3-deoxy-D-manno-octulosonic acid transferase n=1 Tax=Paracoccus albicereus TaxID=2922394 RepID=A0ABT1MSI9_9RHOB|nr:glycosyltransferase N-terminal domain-containing protein [Paracoccus albicereus]MCQ0970699.1 3-deoxy-D-manno-octulosonic acid transferase [Paracoccus albicereus]
MAVPRRPRRAGNSLSFFYGIATRLAEAGLQLRNLVLPDDAWRERLVPPDADIPRRPVWLHAASVGEVNSARMLIDALAGDPGVLVTTNSLTGRATAREAGWPARLAPFDAPGATARFISRAQPSVQVTVEGEFWPNRARALRAASVPQVVIGARMSERSARRWSKMPGLIEPVLSGITALSAQDAGSESRLIALGLDPNALMGRMDLKLIGPAMVKPSDHGPDRDRTILAASTHAGEEDIVIDAFTAARRDKPELRLILAPRHPERGDAVAGLLQARGLPVARRSLGATLDQAAPILLADTLGEMALWYAAAGTCFTGGSLIDHGGHTPWEPAAHNCAILHGPHVGNAAEAYDALDRAGASHGVTAETLGFELSRLGGDSAATRRAGQLARQVLDQRAGDPAPLLARIRALARNRSRAHI